MISTSVNTTATIAGVHFKNPVVMASGTFGFGKEYGKLYDVDILGESPARGLLCRPRPVMRASGYMRQHPVC